MIIFLYGPDSYRSQKKMEEVIENYRAVHKNGLSLFFFDGCNLDFKDLENQLDMTSIFKEKKLLVIKNPLADKKFKDDFLAQIKKFDKTEHLILLYESQEVDKREALFKYLVKNVKAQEFLFLNGIKLETWLKKYLLDRGGKMDILAQKKLIFYVGSDLWQMKNELDKLINYANGRSISLEDVVILTRPKVENDIFATIDSLAEKRKDKAIYLIHKHLEKGDSAIYLLSMINFQFRNLLIIRDLLEKRIAFAEITKRSGLHPFVAKKTYWQAEKFTLLQLKKIYRKIFQIDLAIKTGKLEPETALDVLIAGL